MKGKNLIMCGLCACIGFIGGEVRAYHKVLNELRTMERPKVTYMKQWRLVTDLCPFIFRLMAVFLFRSSRGRTRRHSAT